MATNDEAIKLDYTNIPVDSGEALVKEVQFGGDSEDFAVLIEFNPTEGPIRITVGNGPPHTEAPEMIAAVLRGTADKVAELQDDPEYWEQLAAYNE